MDEILPIGDKLHWYVMRNLERKHAKLPTYKMFENLKVQCSAPVVYRLVVIGGERVDQKMPLMQDLPLVKDTKEYLDVIVESTPKLQYRHKLGVQYTPIIIPVADMERFIKAVEASGSPKFYSLDEVILEMGNRRVRIIGGQLDGYTSTLVTTRGLKARRLLVELPILSAASIEAEAEHTRLIP